MEFNQAPPAEDQPQPESGLNMRTIVVVLVTAVAFFAIGYAVAWFSFVSAADIQVADLENTVRSAVSDALADVDFGAAVAEQAPQPSATPSVYDVSIEGSAYIGPDDAPITMVEFSDFRCGYCGRFEAQTLDALLAEFGDQIKFVYRHFPVVGGERAAMASECAASQNVFWEYHDLLFENQQLADTDEAFVQLASELDIDVDRFATCLADDEHLDKIQADFNDGLTYGVRGTPAFFINGRAVIGAQPLAAFRQIINEELDSIETAG